MSVSSFFKGLLIELPVIAGVGGTVVSVFNPALGAIITGIAGKVMTAVTNAETTITQAQSGTIKLSTATADIQSALDITNEILSAKGETLKYDPALLTAAINAQVAAFNAIGTLKSSFQIAKA